MSVQLHDRIDSSMQTWPQTPSPATLPQWLRSAGFSRVVTRTATPPVSPATDALYIPIATATGAFAGHENDVARWTGTAWQFATPFAGWHCWVVDEAAVYSFDGEAWDARTNAGKYFPPVTLEFWIDAAASEGVGDGTQASPWGPIEGLDKARLAIELYSSIAQCVIKAGGAAQLVPPAKPFDGARFGGNGKLAIIGQDFVESVAPIALAAGSTSSRYILSTPISGGLAQYYNASVEIVTGAAAGYRRLIRGHQKKYDCLRATTANITLSGNQTVDGVASNTLTATARILVRAQTNPVENGIYNHNPTGAWTRAGDARITESLEDAQVLVTAGSTLAGTTWYQTAANPLPGTDAQVWSQSDTILTPAAAWNPGAALNAGDTVRIVRPAASIVFQASSGIANVLALGFARGIEGGFVRGGGFYKINLGHTTALASATVPTSGHRIFEFGTHYDSKIRQDYGNCHLVIGNTGVSAEMTWLGVADGLNAWIGWGSSYARVSGTGSFLVGHGLAATGYFNALAGMSPQHNLYFYVLHQGGRLNSLQDGSGCGLLSRSGFFAFGSSYTSVILEGGISARNNAVIDATSNIPNILINNATGGGPILNAVEGGIVQHRGFFKGHAVGGYGVSVSARGQFINSFGTLPVTGDKGDAHTRTKTRSAAWFAANADASIADPDGASITRFFTSGSNEEASRIAIVLDKDLSAPPVSWSVDDAYYVAAGGSGPWAGQSGKIAVAVAPSTAQNVYGSWIFGTLSQDIAVGTSVLWVKDEQKFYVLGNSGLVEIGALLDGSVTLAKLANLAQDQVIMRVSASTGVPETATITAPARTVLDDTSVAAMVDTLGGASSTGTGGLARATSPTFVTPALGAATATSVTACDHVTADRFIAPPGTFAYSATPSLDVSDKQNWSMSSAMTGNMALTLTGGVDGCSGEIDVVQGAGNHKITGITASGRTVEFYGIPDTINTADFLTAGRRSTIGFAYVTVNSVAVLKITMIEGKTPSYA